MSNIGNKIRMGFFATPERQTTYLKELIDFTANCSVLDPTCGEGEVLHQLCADREAEITTYGVELDNQRAMKAKELLTHAMQAPIESMVISNNSFGMTYVNPPYDFSIKGSDHESAERKEYRELRRATKYLKNNGIMIYVIPAYRFADEKIASFLSWNFADVGVLRFTDEDYEDFKQVVFIGKKSNAEYQNEALQKFLLNLDDETFVKSKVNTLKQLNGHKKWKVPGGATKVKTFYTRLENKEYFVSSIRNSKGFQTLINRAKPRELVIGGQPIINLSQGDIALLLASGAINGVIGKGDDLHVVQGVEIVSDVKTVDKMEHDNGSTTTKTTTRTKREASVKVITPQGVIKKYV